LIKLENISKSYKKIKVLKDISLTIKKGELVALIGPSGCGKTTTLKMINGLVKPSSGNIYIDGKSLLTQDLITLRRSMGYVIQQTGLFSHMTVEENIQIIPKLMKKKKEDIQKRTIELLKLINLDPEEFLYRYPPQLSGGQLQRIGVARAFATDPEIILMDEPFSALDPITRDQLQIELIHLQSKLHKTIVFVTHDMDEAVKIADRICLMNEGKIIQYDTPENILKNPVDDFVEQFVGKKRIWSSPELIRASDIMISDPVFTYSETTLLRAIEIMRYKKVDSILIVDDNKILLGYIKASTIQRISDKNIAVSNILSNPKLTATPDQNIIELLYIMRENAMSNIAVVTPNNELLGLITTSSLVTTLSTQFIGFEEEGDLI
jgi:osmoprotectant transport system ATP-binding protein